MTANPHAPIETLSYDLTRADAYAWEVLPRESTGWRHAMLLLWLGLGGITLAFVPADLVGPEDSPRFYAALIAAIAVQYALLLVWRRGTAWLRAVRRLPSPESVHLDVWGDHLAERRLVGTVIVAPDMIRQVVVTPGHVFVDSPPEVLILPRTAFADVAAMRAFADHWDQVSKRTGR